MIMTANHYFRLRPPPVLSWEQWRRTAVARGMALNGLEPQGYQEEGQPAIAHVNHGRWVVTCPCGGDEMAWEEGWIMCFGCFNADIGHRYRRTVFPDAREMIEALLESRPLPNRNWLLEESVDALAAENVAYGLPVGGV